VRTPVRTPLARALALAVVVAFLGHGAAQAECETRVSHVGVPSTAAAPSAGRLNMMLLKSRGLVAEAPRAPAAKARKPAAHRARIHRKAKAAGVGTKARRRDVATASRPKSPRPRPAPAVVAAAPAAAPAFADIRTEVCTNGEPPIRAMLARLAAPPEVELESKVPSAGAPLETAVPGPTDDGRPLLEAYNPPASSTGGPGLTFLPPPATVAPTEPDVPDTEPPFPGPLTPPVVTPVTETPTPESPLTETPVTQPQTGRPVGPGDGGRPPTTLLPPITGPQNPLEPRPVAPIPEPATWVLLIAGFGAIGARLRAMRGRAQAA
jgi:hypothetical protein